MGADPAFVASQSSQQAVSTKGFNPGEEELRAALEPFAAMGRLLEARAIFSGMKIDDQQIVCSSSGEAGLGVLTMGHFRDAAALLPKAPGWGGVYINSGIRKGANQ